MSEKSSTFATDVAPTEEVRCFSNGTITQIQGTGKPGAQNMKDLKKPEYAGQWKYFRNGKLVDTSKDAYLYNVYRQPKQPIANESNGN
ncbi:MAG: hypothetical protein K6A36_08205 [Paludibacteraceae bacterium]|nr:hypothetical protein [Paludibacteraceae bacterium]